MDAIGQIWGDCTPVLTAHIMDNWETQNIYDGWYDEQIKLTDNDMCLFINFLNL